MYFSKTMCSLLLTLPGGLYVTGFGFPPEAAAAQVVDVDEGTFIVELDGRRMGTERFRIRRSGIGDNVRTIAQGTLEIVEGGLGQTVQSGISTLGVGMSLDLYDVKVSTPSELSILLERRGDRMVSVTSSEAGVEEREYVGSRFRRRFFGLRRANFRRCSVNLKSGFAGIQAGDGPAVSLGV